MTKLIVSGRTTKSRLVAEAQMEAERMKDVQILLDHMLRQESVTIKFILDCLYDVGSVNLINQKVRAQPLNHLMKTIAGLSKPAFKIFALRWLYKNCPRLITNWLHRKVRFGAPETQPIVTVNKVMEAQKTPAPAISPVLVTNVAPTATQVLTNQMPADQVLTNQMPADQIPLVQAVPGALTASDRQIRQLKQQVRWLTGMLIGIIVLWGGSVLLPHYNAQLGAAQSQEKVQQP